ncbi:hypothetical protein I317_00107 [Kwoniella heveanensis CBS 569]|nr:hypothetical protein I317_00107 [Kwoniella heveanensis CBS 569]
MSTSRIKIRLSTGGQPSALSTSTGSSGASGSRNEAEQANKKRSRSESSEGHESLDPAEQRIADAKKRQADDIKKHKVDDVKVDKPEDDWQVAYVWVFIVKFNLRGRIARLECMEDFERCLTEPVANRPDDILESILICFLGNLKSVNRAYNPENIQSQLSAYITDQLMNSTEWTVWDSGWPINEADRGSCCTSNPHRTELGRLRYPGEPLNQRAARNPIKQIEEKGGGIFELDWKERIKMLRQLVDWQLSHAENIRNIINREFPAKAGDSRAKKGAEAEVNEKDSIVMNTLGQNRDRARIWAMDDSWRLYKSGNPFKRPCPLVPVTTSRETYEAFLADVETFSSQAVVVPKGTRETAEQRRLSANIKNEQALAETLRARTEVIEKEDARVQRARKRIAQALEWQQRAEQRAEMRSTRTRRQTKKVDYVYDDTSDFEDDSGPSKRSRSSRNSGADDYQYQHQNGNGSSHGHIHAQGGANYIPPERQSSRLAARNSNAAANGQGSTRTGKVSSEEPPSSPEAVGLPLNGVHDDQADDDQDDGGAGEAGSRRTASSPAVDIIVDSK